MDFSRNTALKLTLLTLISQGLDFLDTLYKLWIERKYSLEAFDCECKKWLFLLIHLVSITGDNLSLYLRRFLLGKTGVVKKYRHDITKHVGQLHADLRKGVLIYTLSLF